MSLQEDFQSATERVKTLSKRPSNDALLDLYGLYKQATEGDVTGKKPSRLNFEARAKHDSWEKRKGMSKEDAQKQYIAVVDGLLEKD